MMGLSLSPRDTNDALAVVAQLHRGILIAPEWERALRGRAGYVGADFTTYMIRDRRRNDVIIYDGGLLPDSAGHTYQSHFQHLDPARERLENAPVGSIYVDQLDFGIRNMADSDFYLQFLHPHGIESIMTMVVDRSEDADWLVGFQRVRGRPPFDVGNAVALRTLLVHLQTAFGLKHKVRELQNAQAWSQVTIDKVAFPLVMVDDRMRILGCNHAGERWLTHPDNPLRASVPPAELRLAVSQACGDEHSPARVATFTSPAPSSERQGLLVALPLPAPAETPQEMRRPCVLLVGIGLQHQIAPSDALLRELFALTRSEIALAEKLANGMTLTEASVMAGVGRETVRTHLKSVLRKTGTRRQSELTALLTGLSMVNSE